MERRKSNRVIVTLCLLYGYFGLSRSTEDVPEFQYPCYVDICTFPRQFCNSDKSERRCSPCSTSLCKDGSRIPLACKYHCNKILNVYTKTTATIGVPPTSSYESEEDSTSIYVIVAYNAVLTTLFMITLMISCVWYIQKKRNEKDQIARNPQQLRYQSNVDRARDPAAVPFLQGTASTNCSPAPNDDIPPPSYSTNAPVVNVDINAASGHSLVKKPTDMADPNIHCHPEISETNTQTTQTGAQTSPKSVDRLSFDFSENVLKSRDI